MCLLYLVGVRALLPGAIPLVASVPELLAVVAVGGWLSWCRVVTCARAPALHECDLMASRWCTGRVIAS
jgi:hypothetical protein